LFKENKIQRYVQIWSQPIEENLKVESLAIRWTVLILAVDLGSGKLKTNDQITSILFLMLSKKSGWMQDPKLGRSSFPPFYFFVYG